MLRQQSTDLYRILLLFMMKKFCYSRLYLHSLKNFCGYQHSRAFVVSIHMYTSLVGIKSKLKMCQFCNNSYGITILRTLGQDFHTYKDIGDQSCKMYKRRQQSSGRLCVVAVVKVTPAHAPVSSETVGHIPQRILDLKYHI